MRAIRLSDNTRLSSRHSWPSQAPAHSRGSVLIELRKMRCQRWSSAPRNCLTTFAIPSGSSTILFTPRHHTSPGLNGTFSDTGGEFPTMRLTAYELHERREEISTL